MYIFCLIYFKDWKKSDTIQKSNNNIRMTKCQAIFAFLGFTWFKVIWKLNLSSTSHQNLNCIFRSTVSYKTHKHDPTILNWSLDLLQNYGLLIFERLTFFHESWFHQYFSVFLSFFFFFFFFFWFKKGVKYLILLTTW